MENYLKCDCREPIYSKVMALNMESVRLQTFYTNNWNSHINPQVLARQGFYYLKTNDNVRCYFCHLEIGMWQKNDDPLIEHLKYSPFCPIFMKKENKLKNTTTSAMDNIPINEETFYNLLNYIHGNEKIKKLIENKQKLSKISIYVCNMNTLDVSELLQRSCNVCFNSKQVFFYPCCNTFNTCTNNNKRCSIDNVKNSFSCQIEVVDELLTSNNKKKRTTHSNNVKFKKIF